MARFGVGEENMAVILTNGCFDIFHEGHKRFLQAAKNLGCEANTLVVCVNTDEYARELKAEKHGSKYPLDSVYARMLNVNQYTPIVHPFHSESMLWKIIQSYMPCIIVKGPDYKGKKITGDDIAPVLILDTPEPESVKQMKVRAYSGNNPSQ